MTLPNPNSSDVSYEFTPSLDEFLRSQEPPLPKQLPKLKKMVWE